MLLRRFVFFAFLFLLLLLRVSLLVDDGDELLELELDEDEGSDGGLPFANSLTSWIPEDRRMPLSFLLWGGLSLGSDFLLSPPVPSRLADLLLSGTLSSGCFLVAGVSS